MSPYLKNIPFLSLALLLASMPFDHWNPFLPYLSPMEQTVSLPQALTGVTALIWLFCIFVLGWTQYLRKSFQSPVSYVILVFLLASLLSIVNSHDPVLSFEWLLRRGFLLLFFLLIINLIPDQRALKIVLGVIAFSSLFYIVPGLYELCTGEMFLSQMLLGRTQLVGAFAGMYRIQSLETDPDLLAMVLVLLTGPLFFMIFSSKHWFAKLFWGIVFIANGVCIIAAGSRTGWLTLGMVTVAPFFLIKFPYKLITAISATVLLLITFLVMASIPDLMVMEKIKRTFGSNTQVNDINVSERKAKLIMAIDMARDHPVLGIGTGTFGEETSKYLRRGSRIGVRDIESSLSGFGTLLGENGLLGVGVYLFLQFLIVVEVILGMINTKDKIWRNLGGTILISMLAWIPCFYLFPSLGFRYEWILYGVGTSYAILSRGEGGRAPITGTITTR